VAPLPCRRQKRTFRAELIVTAVTAASAVFCGRAPRPDGPDRNIAVDCVLAEDDLQFFPKFNPAIVTMPE
jgi:hypothetical protein